MRNSADRFPGRAAGRRQRDHDGDAAAPDQAAGTADRALSPFTPGYHPGYGSADAGQQNADAGHGSADAGHQAADASHGSTDGGHASAGAGDGSSADTDGGSGQPAARRVSGADGNWPGDDARAPSRRESRQREPAWNDRGWGDAGWGTGAGHASTVPPSNLIRGFPPVRGESIPPYRHPFTAWNRAASTADTGSRAGLEDARQAGGGNASSTAATISPRDFDTDYSIPAIRDPILGNEQPVSASGGTGPAASGGRGRHSGAHGAPARGGPPGQKRPASPQQPAGSRGGSGRAASQSGSRRGQSGRKPAGRRPGTARSGRPQVKLAIGAAILIVVAAVAYLAWGSSSPPVAGTHPPGHRGRSPSTSPSPSLGPWQYITARTTDPVPLGVQELFPVSFTTGGHTYLRTNAAMSASCKSALVGAGLRAAAQQAGCDQVLRGTYVTARAGEMGTIGVLNLQSFTAATTAGKTTGRSDYIAQLKTNHGLTRKLGNGTGIEEAIVKGHYLILGWAEFSNLSAPKTLARRAELGAFLNTLIQQTANVSLSYRMVDGKPPAG